MVAVCVSPHECLGAGKTDLRAESAWRVEIRGAGQVIEPIMHNGALRELVNRALHDMERGFARRARKGKGESLVQHGVPEQADEILDLLPLVRLSFPDRSPIPADNGRDIVSHRLSGFLSVRRRKVPQKLRRIARTPSLPKCGKYFVFLGTLGKDVADGIFSEHIGDPSEKNEEFVVHNNTPLL